MTTDPSQEREDRRQHLDFVQAVITRMSAASTTTKGWLLPVVTATYGYAIANDVPTVAMLGIGAVLLFGLMDANYLNQERAFRKLYDAIARGAPIPPFALDTTYGISDGDDDPEDQMAASSRKGKGNPDGGKLVDRLRSWIPERAVWSSWSIAPLYGSLLLIGLVVLIGTLWC